MYILAILFLGLAVSALIGDDDTTDPQAQIEGDEGDDTIRGTQGDDLLSGAGGNDNIASGGGSDVLLGDDGDDTLNGVGGDDILYGGDGEDVLQGGAGNDILVGGEGGDALDGGRGDDLLIGADTLSRAPTEQDILEIANGTPPNALGITYDPPATDMGNTLDGGAGNDTLLLGENDIAMGGTGDDRFEIGEWVDEPASVPLITDFNEAEDVLIVRYANGNPPPAISLDTQGSDRLVMADGILVARVQGDGGPFFASDVQLLEI